MSHRMLRMSLSHAHIYVAASATYSNHILLWATVSHMNVSHIECVTLPRDMTHSHVRHDSLIRVTWLVWVTGYCVCMSQNSFTCLLWRGVVSHMHESCVRSYSEWCKCSWLFHIFVTYEAYDVFTYDTTHSYATNIWTIPSHMFSCDSDSFICFVKHVTRTRLYTWLGLVRTCWFILSKWTSPSHMFSHLVSGARAKFGKLMTKHWGANDQRLVAYECTMHSSWWLCQSLLPIGHCRHCLYIYILIPYMYIYVYIYIDYCICEDATCDCSALQHTATHCNTLQHTATHCNTLQLTATHCNTLQQHTATHCNTLHKSHRHIRCDLFICDTSHIYVTPVVYRPHRTLYDMIYIPTERHHCCM